MQNESQNLMCRRAAGSDSALARHDVDQVGVSPAPLALNAGAGLYSTAEKGGLPVPAPTWARSRHPVTIPHALLSRLPAEWTPIND
jgi:hypothetical protein